MSRSSSFAPTLAALVVLLPLAVSAIPPLQANNKPKPTPSTAAPSSLAPQIISVFSSTPAGSVPASLALSAADSAVIAQLATLLLGEIQALDATVTVDVGEEDDEVLNFTSWKDGDASNRCMDIKEYRKRLTNMFKELVNKLSLGKREARALLRELYHMARTQTIGKDEVKCFTNTNYKEMVDVMINLAPVGRGSKYVVTPEPVDIAQIVPVQNAVQGILSSSASLYISISGAVRKITNRVEVPEVLARPLYAKCPYYYQQCCIFYSIPNVINPASQYLQCCFQALYPMILSDWDLYFADLYPQYTPEQYTLLYCLLPSV